MHKHIAWIMAGCIAWINAGCATSRPRTAAEGQAVFVAMQQAAAVAGKKVEPSLALVKIAKGAAAQQPGTPGIIHIGGSSGASTMSGVVLTTHGHVLIPSVVKADEDNRITVFIGENEYVARVLKTDDTLGMTILKLDADENFVPLDFSKAADLAVGEWAVIVRPTDDSTDFQKLSALVACQGEMAGRHRRFLLNLSFSSSSGALVVNLSGQLVGILEGGMVIAASDLRDDLKTFLAEAAGTKSPDDDKKKKGWFGAMLDPINKEYAKAKNLSPSSLWVVHAVKAGSAATAGVHDGDLITALNGKPLRLSGLRAHEYFLKSLHPRVGDKFTVTILRNNAPLEIKGTFGKPPEPPTLRAEDLGVTVSGLNDGEVYTHNLFAERGVLVMEVYRGSPAATSGTMRQTLIAKGDVILELAGQPTATIAAFGKVLETIRRERPPVVLVKYQRGRMTGYAGLNLAIGEKDHGDKQ
ncbi:MAG: trypsin-like peptidase domain-containing protein [Kiritimatiellaeota bacterium]|nr:trypsin-like peptidase domain-containing protein [Kiritimatiellota bacterium]